MAEVDGGMAPIANIDTATAITNNFGEELYASVTAAGDDKTAEADAAQELIDHSNKQDTAPEGTEEELHTLFDKRGMEVEETGVVMDALAAVLPLRLSISARHDVPVSVMTGRPASQRSTAPA